ncbi:unnamed protein product [Rhizophagus irregularis]|uniref:Uncharacterized protein n=1 Tax=Rhizophagus irregularis TaxID=588596 RepID=A0A915ZGI7_9GLOM|nr:unnamed protein product [Rhizophagus irregularis]CAB5375823.1 unnamed protein product [Rhizophagus irregularis]
MTHEYLPANCYTCKKCLICFTLDTCKCDKSVKPTRVGNPQRGQQIYSHVFTLNEELQMANQFLFSANKKFQYNSNFNIPFSFTFCSNCNILAEKEKILEKSTNKMNSISIDVEDTKSSDLVDGEDEHDISEFSEVEDYGIDQIKLQRKLLLLKL